MSRVIQIGQGVTALWGVKNGPFLLLWPVAYTTACTTVQAVINLCERVYSLQCQMAQYLMYVVVY